MQFSRRPGAHLVCSWIALVATLTLVVWCATPAHRACADDSRKIIMNFNEVDLEGVVQFISELTGESFILDERVKGTVTVISPSKLTPAEAYEVFQAILNVKGFTIVPAGRVNKIVQTRDAKQLSIETVREAADPGDRFVTRIVPLAHVDAEAIAGILGPLVSKDSSIVAYAPTNTLIITDSYSNIERLLDIIQSLDVETVDTVLEIIQLRYASAEVMAKNLSQIVTEKSRTARRRTPTRAKGGTVQVQAEAVAVKIIADSRTNSLITIADPDTLAEIKTMVAALDVEIPTGTGKINVYYLKYADAENVASVLTAITKSAGTKAKPGQPTQAKGATAAAPVNFEEPVQITADKTTNSLVIIANPQDYEILRGVIEKLDVRRPQVLVEALIVEMSYEKSLELGVEWRSTNDPTSGNLAGFATQNFGNINSVAGQGPLAVPSGLSLVVVKGTLSFGNETFLNIGALINALQSSGDVNVLSTPNLLTTDNEEAEIVVSDNIPFKTSEKFDSNGNPISTFEYRDVGLTLRFTPQINEDDYVKLKLYQEISQVLSTATGGSTNAPSTTRRTAKTTVVAQTGSTIVIGGLIKDDTETTVNSVPCLGDLPILGHLFRSTTDRVTKRNLLLFLTPHIIKNSDDIEQLSREKRERFEQQIAPAQQGPRTSADKLQEYIGPLAPPAAAPETPPAAEDAP